MDSPSSHTPQVTDTTLELLVFGTAPGTRTPAMMGMLQQAAQHVFGLNITIETLKELDSSRQCQVGAPVLVGGARVLTVNTSSVGMGSAQVCRP